MAPVDPLVTLTEGIRIFSGAPADKQPKGVRAPLSLRDRIVTKELSFSPYGAGWVDDFLVQVRGIPVEFTDEVEQVEWIW